MPVVARLLVGLGDGVVVVDVVVLDEVVVERLRLIGLLDDLLAGRRCVSVLPVKYFDARLARPGRQRLAISFWSPVDEVGVGLVGHDGQLVDVVDGDGVVHPLAVLVDGEPQAAADLLAARDRCCRSS